MFITRFVTGAALVAALAAPLAASAQDAAPPVAAAPGAVHGHPWRHHRGHNPYLRALRSLGLNDVQKQQIRTAMREKREADRLAMRANAEKLRGRIDGILTPVQRTELRTELAQERARHHRLPAAL